MKLPTWKQLHARGRELGVTVSDFVGGHNVAVVDGADGEVCSFESWIAPRADDLVLRAAVDAALVAMTPARHRKGPATRKARSKR